MSGGNSNNHEDLPLSSTAISGRDRPSPFIYGSPASAECLAVYIDKAVPVAAAGQILAADLRKDPTQPQPFINAALPLSSVDRRQYPVCRPHCQCKRLPFNNPSRLPSSSVVQQQHPVHSPNLVQHPAEPSHHPSRPLQPPTPALTAATLRPISKDQYGNSIYTEWEWAKIKTFEEVMEEIKKDPKYKVTGRKPTMEEELWNKALIRSLEMRDIYSNKHIAGKPPGCDEFLYPSSLFNPLGEREIPQAVTKPPSVMDVFKRAQRLVGADKLPWNLDTKKRCEMWTRMLSKEHKIQIAMGFIVPRGMRATKRTMEADGDDVEPPRKIGKMSGNNDNKKDNNNNDGDDDYCLD